MLRSILSQTMDTLKIARRRVDEQQRQLEVLEKLSTTDMATGLLNLRGLHFALRRISPRQKGRERRRIDCNRPRRLQSHQ